MSTASRVLRSSNKKSGDRDRAPLAYTKEELRSKIVPEDTVGAVAYVCRRRLKKGVKMAMGTFESIMTMLGRKELFLMAPVEDLPAVYALQDEGIDDDIEELKADEIRQKFCLSIGAEYHGGWQRHLRLNKLSVNVLTTLDTWREHAEDSSHDDDEMEVDGGSSVVPTPTRPRAPQFPSPAASTTSVSENDGNEEGLRANDMMDLGGDDDGDEDGVEEERSERRSALAQHSLEEDAAEQKREADVHRGAGAHDLQLEFEQHAADAQRDEELQKRADERRDAELQRRANAQRDEEQHAEEERLIAQREADAQLELDLEAEEQQRDAEDRVLPLPGAKKKKQTQSKRKPRGQQSQSPISRAHPVISNSSWNSAAVQIVQGDASADAQLASALWQKRDQVVAKHEVGEAPTELWIALTDAMVDVWTPKQLFEKKAPSATLKNVMREIVRVAGMQLDMFGGAVAMYEVAREKAQKAMLRRSMKASMAGRKRRFDEIDEVEEPLPAAKFSRSNQETELGTLRAGTNAKYWQLELDREKNGDQRNGIKAVDMKTRALYGEWIADINLKSRVVEVLMSKCDVLTPQSAALNKTIADLVNKKHSNEAMAGKINKKRRAMAQILSMFGDSDDENDDATGVSESKEIMAPRTTKSQMAAKSAIVGWLVCEPNDGNAGFGVFMVEAFKFLKRVSYFSSASAHAYFSATASFEKLFEGIAEWLEAIEITEKTVQKALEIDDELVILRVTAAVSLFVRSCTRELTQISDVLRGIVATMSPTADELVTLLDRVQRVYLTGGAQTFRETLSHPLTLASIKRMNSPMKLNTVLCNQVPKYVTQEQESESNAYRKDRNESRASRKEKAREKARLQSTTTETMPRKRGERVSGAPETMNQLKQALDEAGQKPVDRACFWHNMSSGCRKRNECSWKHVCVGCGESTHVYAQCRNKKRR